jgi:hypothetical protein
MTFNLSREKKVNVLFIFSGEIYFKTYIGELNKKPNRN